MPHPSSRLHQCYNVCLEFKREDYQNCAVCCVWQLCTVICTREQFVSLISHSFLCFYSIGLYFFYIFNVLKSLIPGKCCDFCSNPIVVKSFINFPLFFLSVQMLLAQRDTSHVSIHKKRRCFLWNNHYFQLDIYEQPCPPK